MGGTLAPLEAQRSQGYGDSGGVGTGVAADAWPGAGAEAGVGAGGGGEGWGEGGASEGREGVEERESESVVAYRFLLWASTHHPLLVIPHLPALAALWKVSRHSDTLTYCHTGTRHSDTLAQ